MGLDINGEGVRPGRDTTTRGRIGQKRVGTKCFI